MKTRIRKMTSLLLSFSLLGALSLPAAASEALGEDLSAKDTVIHEETQLSTNVFWSTAYSDLRTENLITYSPNKTVTPIVTYGGVLTDRSSVADTANALEGEGYRVVAGINGDFYNVSTGLPIGLVITDGVLRSSDAGYYAIGFRADGTAVLGKPGVKVSADLGYAVDDGSGSPVELIRPVIAVNKARTNSGVFLYTYDFNAKHTTGTTEAGVNVVCTVEQGQLAIGSTVTARVERVEETTVTSIQPDQIVLSANANADAYYTNALRNMSAGSEVTLTVSANAGWDDVEYAVGALYCLAENGAVVSGLAAATYAKAYGITFLGAPRSRCVEEAHRPRPRDLWPLAIPAFLCVAGGLASGHCFRWLISTVNAPLPDPAAGQQVMLRVADMLGTVSLVGMVLLALVAALWLLRKACIAGRLRREETWGCGYRYGTARVQYTDASFSEPLGRLFGGAMGLKVHQELDGRYFPGKASVAISAPDRLRTGLFTPLFEGVEKLCNMCKILQHGKIHLYILYILATLVALLAWGLHA